MHKIPPTQHSISVVFSVVLACITSRVSLLPLGGFLPILLLDDASFSSPLTPRPSGGAIGFKFAAGRADPDHSQFPINLGLLSCL